MNAAAEPDMPDKPPFDVVVLGALPVPRVAVGGAEKHQHLLALAEWNATESRPYGWWYGRRFAPGSRSAPLPRTRRGPMTDRRAGGRTGRETARGNKPPRRSRRARTRRAASVAGAMPEPVRHPRPLSRKIRCEGQRS